jgi:hypothetical protein
LEQYMPCQAVKFQKVFNFAQTFGGAPLRIITPHLFLNGRPRPFLEEK